MKNGIQNQFEQDSASIIILWSQATSMEYKGLNPNRRIALTKEDYKYAEKKYADNIESKSTRRRRWGVLTTYKKESGSYAMVGCMPDMLSLENNI